MKSAHLILLIILISCNQSKNSEKASSIDLTISEDKNFLYKKVSFSQPKSWVKMDIESIAQLDTKYYKGSKVIIQGFEDPNSNSYLLALKRTLNTINQDSIDYENGKWIDLNYSSSFNNDLYLNQTILQDRSKVLFKISVGTNIREPSVGALHFYVDREDAKAQLPLIKACISSIQRN